MAVSSIWRRRWNNAIANVVSLLWVAVIYLASELVLWGLSRTLSPAGLEFFASILGMVLVFLLTTVAYVLWTATDPIYHDWIKPKIDFINAHLGLGFPIPIIMLDQSEILDGHDIARVVGTLVITNMASWMAVFVLSILMLTAVIQLGLACNHHISAEKSLISASSEMKISSSDAKQAPSPQKLSRDYSSPRALSDPEQQTPGSSQQASRERTSLACTDESIVWGFLMANYAVLLSFTCVFVVGVPIAVASRDERFIDAFSLWFIWISSVKSQRAFKNSQICACAPHLKRALATIMNPVLVAILLMTGYTRAKASAFGEDGLAKVLSTFSSGTPLYALWTAAVSGTRLPNNPSGWFGAGDAALSILECGILTWGFKLSECRRQIFSTAGLITVVVCTAAAAGNVFLSVLVGRAMGLNTPEALGFAARSTTLALAKPATEAIAGNVVVNATLVVSNGILGQLVYPFALDKLGVAGEAVLLSRVSGGEDVSCVSTMQTDDGQLQSASRSWEQAPAGGDSPITIAAGIAIGINGAAMGVSYLYETRSHAAPYAALAMAVFGVMTVIFTTVEPFTGVVVGLASR